MDEVDRMLAETPGQVHRTGSLRIAADDAELADCEEQFAAMQAAGLPVERYSGPEGRGLLFPHDAVFNPLARNRLLASRAIAAGARLFEDSVVTEIAAGQVASATGRVSARAIVVTSDAGLPELLPELADDIRPLGCRCWQRLRSPGCASGGRSTTVGASSTGSSWQMAGCCSAGSATGVVRESGAPMPSPVQKCSSSSVSSWSSIWG